MHLIIYGPEGSGKGTQAKLLGERLNLPVYTSGDLVREAAAHDKGPVSNACRKALVQGRYVADRDMFVLWGKKLKTTEAKEGFILDGFPRNINQARFLLNEVARAGYNIDKLIYLELTDEEAIKRLAKRQRKLFVGSKINHDDPQRVKQRLTIYRNQEEEVLKLFRSQNLLLEVGASGSIEKITDDIIRGLDFK